jgi:hypothetical protein
MFSLVNAVVAIAPVAFVAEIAFPVTRIGKGLAAIAEDALF